MPKLVLCIVLAWSHHYHLMYSMAGMPAQLARLAVQAVCISFG